TDRTVDAIAAAENFTALEALEIHLPPAGTYDRAAAGARLATLARSPHLAGLRELKVVGGLDANGVAAAIRDPVWKRLRKLELEAQFWYDPFIGSDDLPELEELRIWEVRYGTGPLPALARAPLLKR